MVRKALLLCFLLAPMAMSAPARAALPFDTPCDRPWECATLTVPLDRSGAVPGSIDLHVERIGSGAKSAGVLVPLAGGPGQAAGDQQLVEGFNRYLAAGLRGRDLVVMDRRGSGGSGALRCPALQRADLTDATAEAAACADRLGARRPFYTTAHAVADLEDLRRALEVEKLTLYGVSYGVQYALAYAATHPDRVERLILDSVLGPAGPDPLYRASTAAIPRVLRALCRSRCADPTPALRELVARAPFRGRAFDGRGRPRRVRITSLDLFDQLKFGDLFPALRGELPAAYAAAADGDPALLARLLYRDPEAADGDPAFRVEEYSQGLFAAATCEEAEFPWDRTTPIADRREQARARAALMPGSAFAPFDSRTALDSDLMRLCERWPVAAAPPPMPTGPFPDVPVLILNGENDLRTPLSAARELAREFPRSTLVSDRVGHSVLFASSCAQQAVRAFFRDRRPAGCRRAARVPVRERPPRTAKRPLAAFEATLRDIALRFATDLGGRLAGPVRAGGLRGGWIRAGNRRSRLRRYTYVPRFRVSGVLRVGPRRLLSGEFTMRRRGKVSLAAGRLVGRLDGRRVSAKLRVRAPRP